MSMWYVPAMVRVVIDDPEVLAKVRDGGDALKSLCREEVERFHRYLMDFGGDYKEGLTRWERSAVEGYLYQKIRGHIDAPEPRPAA
jgi:hypothetical protein